MYQKFHLSHKDALKIVQTIQEALQKQGKEAAIAVTDSQGELLAFLRTDGCKLPSINIAINKAFSAARDQRRSILIGQASKEQGFPMTNYGDIRYTAWGGGYPIIFQGQIVGAVGVSGLTEAEDMELAKLGIDLFN
jgi:glc operon protein GlcG